MTEGALKKGLRHIFTVVSSPPVLFSAGNFIWSFSSQNKTGTIVTGLILALALGAQIRQALTGSRGLPYGVLCAANLSSAVFTMMRGHTELGSTAHLLNVFASKEARKYTFSALACLGWASAHFIRGHKEKYGKNPPIGSQPFHAGYADLAMIEAYPVTAVNVPSLLFVAAGFLRALPGVRTLPLLREFNGTVNAPSAFVSKHATPNRLYALSYILGGLLADNFFYTAAQIVWGIGYCKFETERNADIIPDAKKAFGPLPAALPAP